MFSVFHLLEFVRPALLRGTRLMLRIKDLTEQSASWAEIAQGVLVICIDIVWFVLV